MATETTAVKNKKSDAVILVGALIVFGLILGGFGLFRYDIGKKSADWPSTAGKITYSRSESRRVDKQTRYSPTVKYTYQAAGRRYVGSRISASDMHQKSLSGADKILRKYPTGGRVTVYYNPDDPAVAVLEPGMPKNVFVLLACAAACFGLAVLVSVSAARQKNVGTQHE
jgi:hypothetical protein